MIIDINEMLLFFDTLLPATEEEQGIYWLATKREDGFHITFVFSIYENYVTIIIKNESELCIASMSLKNCTQIKILDQNKKCLEIVDVNGKRRCFLSLLGDSILDYND